MLCVNCEAVSVAGESNPLVCWYSFSVEAFDS